MSLDAPLIAAAALTVSIGSALQCSADDAVRQLQLAHVLLDGAYDGVTTIADALSGGDHGLGTLSRLDGELVVVDGEPWQVDWHGHARVVPGHVTTPFVVLSTMERPTRVTIRDMGRDEVIGRIAALVDEPAAIVSVRLEGRFDSALVRSVPPQDPPYRPYAEVCRTDEVRWLHEPFDGVFVGFLFPEIGSEATIPGLHLHGLTSDRRTGGHNHDLRVRAAELTVSVSRSVSVQLPERSMVDVLLTPPRMRALQRNLLRRGPRSARQLAVDLGIDEADANDRLRWLAERGFVEPWQTGLDSPTERWRAALRPRGQRMPDGVADALSGL